MVANRKKAVLQKTPFEKMKKLGIESSEQAIMLMPSRHIDLSGTAFNAHQITADSILPVEGVLCGRPYQPKSKRGWLIDISLLDGAVFRVMFFFNPHGLFNETVPGRPERWLVKTTEDRSGNGCPLLLFQERLPNSIDYPHDYLGVYPGTKGFSAEEVRLHVLSLARESSGCHVAATASRFLDALQPFSQQQILSAWEEVRGVKNASKSNLTSIFNKMHHPESLWQADMASLAVKDLTALGYLIAAIRSKPTPAKVVPIKVSQTEIKKANEAMPFEPTSEQLKAVDDILSDLAGKEPMHRLLSGDVGTGKTYVFAIVSYLLAKKGEPCCILLPSEPMVNQVASEMEQWWPEVGDLIECVTGSAPKKQLDKRLSSKKLLIGTTALLSRLKNLDFKPRLIIVDEQQRFSVAQRQGLMESETHLLEATATCMPRTMAQCLYGLTDISKLTQPCKPKHYTTTLVDQLDFEAIQQMNSHFAKEIKAGYQILFIFASKEDQDGPLSGEEKPRLYNIKKGFQAIANRFGEDKVVQLHGSMKSAEKEEAIARMKSGQASIMCATTAAEVGLNIPGLRTVAVMNPERLGLVTMHQLRGRAARNGGEGFFFMITDQQKLKEHSLQRLSALTETTDGFRLSELDFELRGMGDINFNALDQSGSNKVTFLLPARSAKLIPDNLRAASSMLDILS